MFVKNRNFSGKTRITKNKKETAEKKKKRNESYLLVGRGPASHRSQQRNKTAGRG
jgi:hypothetical protein